MKEIKLTKGKIAIVDDDDFEWLNKRKWCISTKGYAVSLYYIGHGHKNRKAYWIYMHREVNKTPTGFQTDHINQNKLDNRKSNLRTVTNQMNHFNMPVYKTNKSGHKGVYLFKRDKKWQAQITVNAKKIHLGFFDSINDAINARKKAERVYHAI